MVDAGQSAGTSASPRSRPEWAVRAEERPVGSLPGDGRRRTLTVVLQGGNMVRVGGLPCSSTCGLFCCLAIPPEWRKRGHLGLHGLGCPCSRIQELRVKLFSPPKFPTSVIPAKAGIHPRQEPGPYPDTGCTVTPPAPIRW